MIKWPDTDMYFIHPSSPAPLGAEAGEDHPARMLGCMGNCAQGDRECDPECAEIRSAQDGGKRMTDQEVGEAWANIVTPIVLVIAVVAAVWHVVARVA